MDDGNTPLPDVDQLARVAIPGVRILPVVHERVEMAAVVRGILHHLEPAAVAVELPTTLATAVERAVRRLPKISIVISQGSARGEEIDGGGEEALVWVVAPGDPFAEALRWCAERSLRTFLIDPDVRYVERHQDPVPDPYAMWNLGVETYLDLLQDCAGESLPRSTDALRLAGMAYHVQQARRRLQGELLVLVGAAHARHLTRELATPTAQPLARVRRSSVEVRHLKPESLTGVLPDPPLAHAAFEILRHGPVGGRPHLGEVVPRRVSLFGHGFRVIAGERDEALVQRRWDVARYAASEAAGSLVGPSPAPDRKALGGVIWRIASSSYAAQTGESTKPWQRRLFFDFARRYSRTGGLLVPGLYEWVVAGRGAGDDNLAWEIFDVARTYPWQGEEAEIPTAHIDGSELNLGSRKVRFRRRFFRVKQRPLPVRQRPEVEDPGEWLKAFGSGTLCSYPAEDLVIEDYGRFLQRKAISILSSERTRTEPFTTSLLDGIDLRETLRHVYEGKIYVREFGRVPGDAGSVVVIFDPDPKGERFPYLMTWHGEHGEESDMAFYSSHPGEQVVGPGIMRATYGGFLLTWPPGRLFDVWRDPEYARARSRAEVLLMAGVDYSQERIIVHVGSDSPRSVLRSYAAAQDKRILHIPIGSLSPVTRRKIRVVHVLVGHDKRRIAKDYIW